MILQIKMLEIVLMDFVCLSKLPAVRVNEDNYEMNTSVD